MPPPPPSPRQSDVIREFARQMAIDAKQGPDHLSMAFTYNVLAWDQSARWRSSWLVLDDARILEF